VNPMPSSPSPQTSSAPTAPRCRKSRGNAIELRASKDDTARLIRTAKTDTERVITYDPDARLEIVDGHTHLGQLSVLPEYGRLGFGTTLVHAACQWSRRHGFRFLSLATFSDISFNAPFYRRLGVCQLTDDQIGPDLDHVVTDAADLERFGMRVTMSRTLVGCSDVPASIMPTPFESGQGRLSAGVRATLGGRGHPGNMGQVEVLKGSSVSRPCN